MTEKEFIEKCCIALEVESGELDRDSSQDSVETWDSLGMLSLIAMIDTELEISMEGDELQELETLGKLIDELKLRGILE